MPWVEKHYGEIDEKYYDAKSDDDDEEEVKYEDVDVEEFETLLKDTADYLHSINSRMSATNTNNNAMSDLPISTKFMSSSKSAFSRVGSITSSNALRVIREDGPNRKANPTECPIPNTTWYDDVRREVHVYDSPHSYSRIDGAM